MLILISHTNPTRLEPGENFYKCTECKTEADYGEYATNEEICIYCGFCDECHKHFIYPESQVGSEVHICSMCKKAFDDEENNLITQLNNEEQKQ